MDLGLIISDFIVFGISEHRHFDHQVAFRDEDGLRGALRHNFEKLVDQPA